MMTFPSAPHHVRTRHKASASKRKSIVFFRDRTQLKYFFKIPQILRALPVHDVIHIHWSTFLSGIFILDICERHILPARTLTPALKFSPN